MRSIFPSEAQWKGWSLPSKLTAVGTYAGLAGLLWTVVALAVENYELRRESLYIEVGKYVDRLPIDIREGYGNHLPWQLTFAFPVTIINQGLRPATITRYELTPDNCEYQYTFRGQDGDQGLFLQPYDTVPVPLPLVVGPGEGKTVFLKSAVVVTLDATSIAVDLTDGTLRDLLLKVITSGGVGGIHRGMDLFGNEIEYGVGVRGLVDYDFVEPDSVSQPTYRLDVYTARGASAETRFGPYTDRITKRVTADTCEVEPFSKDPTLQLHEDEAPRSRSGGRGLEKR